MINRNIAEGVVKTRGELRRMTLEAVLEEFDGKIMGLEACKRREKYAKMLASPYSFYRGSAYLFYYDATQQYFPYHSSPERPTWIQGDLHFENFGAFRNENGALVYDVNDFDEGYLGSYLYDLLRMSVSIALVCRQLGWSREQEEECAELYIEAYYERIHDFCDGKKEPGRYQLDEDNARGPVKKLLRKLEKRRAAHFLEQVTASLQEERAFVDNEELKEPSAAERALLETAWPSYLETLQSREHAGIIKDAAIKEGSGTASIGLSRYYLLIAPEGTRDKDGSAERVLEAKEVRIPIPAYFLPYSESFWLRFSHQGERVTATQRAMHHRADPYLGYFSLDGRDFYVRERSAYKKRLKLEDIESFEDMEKTVVHMGRLTAKLHARADSDIAEGLLPYHSEEEIAGAMGPDGKAMARYLSRWASLYADQVETDYTLFQQWVRERSPG
ncbi:DUF2252 domain-containing protein [Paenibacillus spiritus]|uniref:DUF2252 domain-containing protein n=1 Tax=Paenibacillus spiritus TaxID=2496557 RepID=A0A5J5G131_9BACL|nr:DUF2252 family protein [Paenibacillus spiritus]KAA9000375.1 DUF2252 domain-containing protein [Paenibacillus spiritus]